MTDHIQGSQAVELLEAAGFVRLGERGLVNMVKIQARSGMETELWLTVRDADSDATPDADATDYVVVVQGKSMDRNLVLRTDDARDVAALHVACRNTLLLGTGDPQEVSEEHSFMHGRTRVANPFADLVYGDWLDTGSPNPWEMHLGSPVEAYGDAYVAWRDGLAVALLPGLEATGPRM